MPLLYADGSPCLHAGVRAPLMASATPSFQCDRCAYVGPAYGEHTGNFGHEVPFPDRTYCKACCRDRDMELMEAQERISTYLLGDGFTIGTWHGLPLMRCTSCTLHRKAGHRGSGWDVYNLRAIDSKGRVWVGRGGGKGMYCNLRLAKRQGKG